MNLLRALVQHWITPPPARLVHFPASVASNTTSFWPAAGSGFEEIPAPHFPSRQVPTGANLAASSSRAAGLRHQRTASSRQPLVASNSNEETP